MRSRHFVAPLLACLLCVSAWGQKSPTPKRAAGQQAPAAKVTVARFYNVMPKEGHGTQLEQGIKHHIAFHRQAGDQSAWMVWTIDTGPDVGGYLVGTLGHQWADFEHMELGPKDMADVEANITPHVQRVSSSIWLFRGDISPSPETMKPSKFDQVIEYMLHPEGVPTFENTVKQITSAMMKVPAQKRAGPPPMLYQLFAGGEGPRIALVFPRDSWGDFAPHGTNPIQALQQALGAQKAQQIMHSAGKAVRYSWVEILRYRPDLSSPMAGEAAGGK